MSAPALRLGLRAPFLRGSELQSVESLLVRIDGLTIERQALRERHAGRAALERNRLSIAHMQWKLSYALIERYLPAAARQSAA
jgi:hypothetical protein